MGCIQAGCIQKGPKIAHIVTLSLQSKILDRLDLYIFDRGPFFPPRGIHGMPKKSGLPTGTPSFLRISYAVVMWK